MTSDFTDFTDYRCHNGHIFSVPWGDEYPRSTVVCPRCGATSFIHGTAPVHREEGKGNA